ncbi:translesion DNA synthesis-associated protein ImuA [Caenimonas terrae]|uniref:Translesion DNA synthesis-associated protein ImuA n=1 Tax=Caenimonas terrae TaxID=696074 RepID=A0ABW0NFT8_9BURK
MSSPLLRVIPDELPHVWQGREMACAEEGTVASGHAALDAELPGGGWPLGLVEVLQERPEQHVWQLAAPALARLLQSQAGPVVLVAAPFQPFVPGLQAQGIAGERLLWIRAAKPAERLWATEQALRCAEVAAVLAWLPQARSAELRRLQMAAQQHKHLLFVFRTLRSAQEASPARVRLQVAGTEQLEVGILKRRGPPLEQPLLLPAHPVRLAALLQARKRRPSSIPRPVAVPDSPNRRLHVLDRVAAIG